MTWRGENEPVRRNGLTAALIVSGATLFTGLAAGLASLDTPTTISVAIVVCGTIGVALGQLGVILGYTNAARNEATGPKTVEKMRHDYEDEIVDAASHPYTPLEGEGS